MVQRTRKALATLLDLAAEEVEARSDDASGADLVISAAGRTFVAEILGTATPGAVATQAERVVRAGKKIRRRSIPLLVVPFMGEAAGRVCDALGVSWLDLSGNAHVVAPGLRVIVEGRPNKFLQPGRPATVFAPKSARVVRWLLSHPGEAFTQRAIAQSTRMSEGFVSRIVGRLEAEGYVVRENEHENGAKGRGPVRVRDGPLLLDAWRDAYQFEKHTIFRGHVAARSGDALARLVSDTLAAENIEHAATALAAAWQLTHFAAYRTATFFVTDEPSEELKTSLGFLADARGANLWLVAPNDAGVFDAARDVGGMRCVHPVQAYLDLKKHPERATEAAERLRAECLNWKQDA